MDAADLSPYGMDLVRFEARHLICCDPAYGSCNLRAVEVERLRRTSQPEWARFQLAAHTRADVLNATAELWPETRGLDWEMLDDDGVRSLADLPQALWVLIIRGAFPDGEYRVQLPAGQTTASRFGQVTWRQAERITRHHQPVIKQRIDGALHAMLGVLNRGIERATVKPTPRAFGCTPGRHVFAIGGTPHPNGRCWCLATTYEARAKVG